MERECCGTCRWNRHDNDGNGVRQKGGFYCGNEESMNCGCPTFYDDACDDYEEKDDGYWDDRRRRT